MSTDTPSVELSDEEADNLLDRLVARAEERDDINLSRLEKNAISRRTLLAGMAGGAGIAALTGNASAAPSWSNSSGSAGTSADPLSAGYIQNLTSQTVDTDELSVSSKVIQTAANGLVVPVTYADGSGGGVGISDAIDPANTTTPVQDAVDLIELNAARGAVILPPGNTDEAGAVTLSKPIALTTGGWWAGLRTTTLTADGVVSSGAANASLDMIILNGDDLANRTGGSALRFASSNPEGFNIGRVRFANWGGPDPIVDVTSYSPFSSDWGFLNFGSGNEGVNISGSGAVGWSIDNTLIGRSDSGVGISLDNDCNIGTVNVGSGVTVAIDHTSVANSFFSVGWINYETNGATARPAAVELGGDGTVWIGGVEFTSGTLDYIYELNNDVRAHANNILGPATVGGTLNNTKVNVAGDPGGESWYFGPSADITVNHAGTLEGEVRSLATAGTGNG